jgi:hypothetical protein
MILAYLFQNLVEFVLKHSFFGLFFWVRSVIGWLLVGVYFFLIFRAVYRRTFIFFVYICAIEKNQKIGQ